ncbi:purine nucleoside phosphorylase YfiH [Candidatus Pantoea persica]|uniref:purine nucleoside phosphorylase YfiH n=1 Tax=Candidatus Pantoea persica TaxID=2518128 RepID=UPI00215DBC49|nr:purine nucleoside phosphorylase YfiH [Candidatus Pantoea persica]MBA2816081.1 Laccase domain protein YfiH [Candidatus Pantoea persica]
MSLLLPDWPAPANVRACSTLRRGGVSLAPWDTFNLGAHVGDDPAHVAANRQRLVTKADLPAMPRWLEQVHGTEVARLLLSQQESLQADACITREMGVVCAVMTADCLPVLFCSDDGSEVAAAHAGWRGLCGGVLEQTLMQFALPASRIHTWLGPAIGPEAFEIGGEVRAAFIAKDTRAKQAFRPAGAKYFADIWLLAQQRLQVAGVKSVSAARRCTFHERDDFFSYRRDGTTGRMASLIWLR